MLLQLSKSQVVTPVAFSRVPPVEQMRHRFVFFVSYEGRQTRCVFPISAQKGVLEKCLRYDVFKRFSVVSRPQGEAP